MRKFLRNYFFQLLPSFTSWLILFSIELYQNVYDLNRGNILFPIPNYIHDFFYFLFLFFIYQAGKYIVKKEAKPKSLEIIWLIVGFGGTGIIINALSNWIRNIYMSNYSSIFWYNLDKNIGILSNSYFFISLLFVFRQLILFRSNQFKQNSWFYLDFLVCISFFLVFNKYLSIPNYLLAVYFLVCLAFILYLTIHTEWVAYLTFKEKLLGIFFMFVIFIIELSYLFFVNVKYTAGYIFYIEEHLPLSIVYLFTLIYTFFCILVLAFNLPTSSLYELRKLEREAISEINRVFLKSKFDYYEVYQLLIHHGILCAKADFGWIKISQKNEIKLIEIKGLEEKKAYELHKIIEKYWYYQKNKKSFFVGDSKRLSLLKENFSEFESFFATKISTQDKEYGELVLGWKYKNAFEIELHSFLSIICEQSAIAIENKELFKKSISLERYQEQLKIAKDFQEKVLPKVTHIEGFDLHSINQEADEIGGDYLEIYQDEKHIHILIADVAGKGTTAAFYMAELKGMLQVLFPLNLEPFDFIQKLNMAVSKCLANNLFITVNYLKIEKKLKKCQFIRAGHTPILHYIAKENKVLQYQPKGIGLGIIRKLISEKNFEILEFHLKPNDVILLFTDGIIEARNEKNEELGTDILKDWLKNFSSLSATELNYSILEQMMAFTNENKIDDDYTLLTLKVE